MSKKSIYVSPSVESVDVDSDVNVCAMSGNTGGGGKEEPVWPDDENGDDDETIL